MPIEAIVFIGAMAILFSVAMLFQHTLYGSALCLLGVLAQVAAFFFLLGGELLGWLQLLVYAGAILVLIAMAVMSAPPTVARPWAPVRLPRWLQAAFVALLAIEAGYFVRLPGAAGALRISRAMQVEMAALLFGREALLTEAVGLILLISAFAVAQEQR